MKTSLPTIITQYPHYEPSQLVSACAWCPASTYQKLESNQYYTHGICTEHKSAFLAQIKSRIARMRLLKKGGTMIRMSKDTEQNDSYD